MSGTGRNDKQKTKINKKYHNHFIYNLLFRYCKNDFKNLILSKDNEIKYLHQSDVLYFLY